MNTGSNHIAHLDRIYAKLGAIARGPVEDWTEYVKDPIGYLHNVGRDMIAERLDEFEIENLVEKFNKHLEACPNVILTPQGLKLKASTRPKTD